MTVALIAIALTLGAFAGALIALRVRAARDAAALQDALTDAATAGAARRAANERAAVLRERLTATDARYADLLAATEQRHAERTAALERRAADQADHAEQLAAAERRVELVAGNREQLRDEMKAMSADVLKPLGAQLTREIAAQRQADQGRADGELAKRTAEINAVVEPVTQTLGRVDQRVVELEKIRTEADGRLGERLRALHVGVGALARQADNLTAALKRPATRGSWGEIQLRRAIEFAGLVVHVDYALRSDAA